jgi:mono/diheme cytochrome c family protein
VRTTIRVALVAIAVLVVGGLGFVYSGIYDVAADSPHWPVTYRLLQSLRDRSIAVRARSEAAPPALDDPKLIAMGAEHYDEMCTGCHLAPGMEDSELRAGLYPKPPKLAQVGARRSPAERFWIIKHGVKMTAMPAWGTSHDDHAIWAMVAFVGKLPQLSPAAYRELVGSGGDHDHEHAEHDHEARSAEH